MNTELNQTLYDACKFKVSPNAIWDKCLKNYNLHKEGNTQDCDGYESKIHEPSLRDKIIEASNGDYDEHYLWKKVDGRHKKKYISMYSTGRIIHTVAHNTKTQFRFEAHLDEDNKVIDALTNIVQTLIDLEEQ